MDTRERNFIQLPSKVTTAKLNGGSNSYMFTDIKILSYIRSVQCNVQIINGSKSPEEGFGLVIIRTPKTNIIIPLRTQYYKPQNTQNTTSQTALKHYNEFINVRTEYLIWVKMTTDTGIKFKVETSSKKRDE